MIWVQLYDILTRQNRRDVWKSSLRGRLSRWSVAPSWNCLVCFCREHVTLTSSNPCSFTAAGENVNIFKLKNHSGSRRTPVWKAKGGQILQLHYTCVSNPVAGQRGQVRCSVLSDTGEAQIPPPAPQKAKPSVMFRKHWALSEGLHVAPLKMCHEMQHSCLCLWNVHTKEPGFSSWSRRERCWPSRPWTRAGVISVGSCVASQGIVMYRSYIHINW